MALGLLLAAGAGSRMGRPKALVTDADGTSWMIRALTALRDGGCAPLVVVLGAEHESARRLLADSEFASAATVVVADDWSEGMSASLRAGLRGAAETDAASACITLVDLPDVGPRVVHRVTSTVGEGYGVLGRAAYRGKPGHPVVIGRDHWAGVAREALGDTGARDYLAAHATVLVDCDDLATGHDIDTPEIVR